MTEPTERDRRLLGAVDGIGPVSVYALSYHAAADEFATEADLEERLDALADAGYLRSRALPGVTGDCVTEYETAASAGDPSILPSDLSTDQTINHPPRDYEPVNGFRG